MKMRMKNFTELDKNDGKINQKKKWITWHSKTKRNRKHWKLLKKAENLPEYIEILENNECFIHI